MGAENRRSGSYGYILQGVMRDKRLSVEAKAVYAYLSSFADSDGHCFPAVDTICGELGMSKARYYRHFRQLTEMGIVQVNQSRRANRLGGNVYCIVQPRFVDAQSENIAYVDSQSENTAFVDTQKGAGNIPSIMNNPIDSNIPKKETYMRVCEILNQAKKHLRSKGRLKPDRFITDEAFRIYGSDDALIAAARAFAKDAIVLLKRGFTWYDFRDYCSKQNLSPKTGDTKSKEEESLNERKRV